MNKVPDRHEPDTADSRQKAEDLLADIGHLRDKEARLTARLTSELEAVRVRYLDLAAVQYRLHALDTDLKRHLRKHRAFLFAEKDKVVLKNGFILHGSESKVGLPRDALERIKEFGWLEAVRVQETLRRDIVSAWPDERLRAIGARRRVQDKYAYEVRRPE